MSMRGASGGIATPVDGAVLWLVEVKVEEELVESMGWRVPFAWVLDGEGVLSVFECVLVVRTDCWSLCMVKRSFEGIDVCVGAVKALDEFMVVSLSVRGSRR